MFVGRMPLLSVGLTPAFERIHSTAIAFQCVALFLQMNLFMILLLLLCTSRVFGEIADRMKLPSLIGELVAGILLGFLAIRLNTHFFRDLCHEESFLAVTDLGIFFLMLLGGTELRVRELAKVSREAVVIAITGMILPLASGFLLGWAIIPESDFKFPQCLFLGTAMSVTAVPASIRVFMDLGKLHTPSGQTIVSAAFIDDLMSLIVLTVLAGILTTGGLPDAASIAMLGLNITIFFVIVLIIKKAVIPKVRGIVKKFHSEEFPFSSLLIAGFAFAALAEALQLHFIVGAFTAGLFFEKEFTGKKTFRRVKKRLNTLTLGFMAPIFFASIGLHLDLGALVVMPMMVLLLVGVAFVSKILGAGLAARAMGHSGWNSLEIGVGMSSRGAIELVIANIALRAGLFDHPQPVPPVVEYMFSAIVIMAVVTTVLTPIALKFIIRGEENGKKLHDGVTEIQN